MLSNPLHRFPPYQATPSTDLLSNTHVPGAPHDTGLDTLAQGSHYTLQQLQHHVAAQEPHLPSTGQQPKHRQHTYGPAARATTGPIRRRISRACDQCNQLRTRCDGNHPCAHCIEFGLRCEYVRERKKRGKASRKDLAAQATAQAASATTGQGGPKSPAPGGDGCPSSETRSEGRKGTKIMGTSAGDEPASTGDKNLNDLGEDVISQSQRTGSLDSLTELNFHGYGGAHPGYDREGIGASHMMSSATAGPYGPNPGSISSYPDLPYGLQAQSSSGYSSGAPSSFRLGTNSLSAYSIGRESASPGWMNISCSPTQYGTQLPQSGCGQSRLRYPVLEPLMPHVGNILPGPLACDLVDLYFASSSSAQMHPMSPYVLGFVFRKRSFLHPTRPRQCQPALLASMLWVAAQTSEAPFLASVPSARPKICQRLLELTVSLLKPLIHTPSGEASPVSSPIVDGAALGGLGIALPGSISMDALTGESGAFGAAGTLDDVVTYIHLATVVSASEYKGASLRWWNASWSLARELKLGRELPHNRPSLTVQRAGDLGGAIGNEEIGAPPGIINEEEREERRRIWWLVYTVDRHLALCYNRPLFLLDIECSGLMQPMDDTNYQNGNFDVYTDPDILASDPNSLAGVRFRGPTYQCSGHSIFGYFLPLMTILGEIVDLHHARNHPCFGISFRSSREWDEQTTEIARHLKIYEESLKKFGWRDLSLSAQTPAADERNGEAVGLTMATPASASGSLSVSSSSGTDTVSRGMGTPPLHSGHTPGPACRLSESEVQTRIVMAYGTHVMHVLHILLFGKWDPINLLDDNDLWISSPGFLVATHHAVDAAEAIGRILEHDPGLEFMPFFFGIYLLQGSFLLLLIADKLQLEASASVVRACETIVRAHEACVVILNTEYQRNFSRVMRSALAQVRGRVPEDLGEQHQRRRELLALYRWTGDGTGLAL